MKKFFNDGIDTIVKMLVTQLGMTMFGIMITMVAKVIPVENSADRNILTLIASGVAVVFYMFLLL